MPIKYENIFNAHKNFVGIMQMNFDKCFHRKKGRQFTSSSKLCKFKVLLNLKHYIDVIYLVSCYYLRLSRWLLSAKEYSRNFLIVDCEKDKHKSKTSLTETRKVNLCEVDISMILKNKYFSNYQKLLNSW